jgi:hypothetical protein
MMQIAWRLCQLHQKPIINLFHENLFHENLLHETYFMEPISRNLFHETYFIRYFKRWASKTQQEQQQRHQPPRGDLN